MKAFEIFEKGLGILGIPQDIISEEKTDFYSRRDYSITHPHSKRDLRIAFSIDTQDQMLLEIFSEEGSLEYEEIGRFEDEDDVMSLVNSI